MRRKWLMLLIFLAFVTGFYLPEIERTEAAKAKTEPAKTVEKQKSCTGCHEDFKTVLPQAHPPVTGNTLSACLECHAPGERGKAEPNKFAARLHLAHLKGPVKADCLVCHTWQPGKSFGLVGGADSYGAPSEEDMNLMKRMFTSAAESVHLDARHVSKDITCAGCHGKDLPKEEDTVENAKCLECHGPAEALAAKTAPKDFPDRNPHKSHLGEINCTVCHSGHGESKVYCLECHPTFNMKMK